MKVKTLLAVFAIPLMFSAAAGVAQTQDAELEQRIFNLGILRTGKSPSKSGKKRVDPKRLLAQVQEDFSKLQVANNELAEVNERAQNLDLEFVVKTVTEIKQRADRLVENLTESKPRRHETKPVATDAAALKSLIAQLDTVVGEFAHNPVFKEATPDDEKLAKQALKDLDQITELSTRILEAADKLKKSP